MKYWTGAHTKHRIMLHIVWIPKYRKRVLKGIIAQRVRELLEECADMNGWKIEELNVQEDHVHMLVQMKPSISISKMIQLFKGGSSKAIRKEFPELQEFLWGDSFWSDGYFAESVGQVNMSVIQNYIRNQ